jgi:3D-(3,5/4)-trihydroxycyclohexane-1,2-dione acylhydrolase (decyclizing)
MTTVRLTVAQAVVRFLAGQYAERDGVEQRLIVGCFGIFGHGNVAGVGQALLEAELDDPQLMPYYLARNEQGMVHAATGFARMRNRLQTYACSASIGPGSTNMVTGAALATISRIPVLLLPSDVFATRVASPVLQELEDSRAGDVSVNDAFRPVSRFFDRVWRPDQLPSALLAAMRVLTDPVETGAVTIALPQDVQAEAHDWPLELFARRIWHVARPVPEPAAIERAAAVIRTAQRPLIVAGGGVLYSEAEEALRAFALDTGIPVCDTQAGKGAVLHDHPCAVGGVGATGTPVANALAAEADVVIGIGTRYSDFTTASRTAFQNPDVRFVNVNVAAVDALKESAVAVVADARTGITALAQALSGYRVADELTARRRAHSAHWDEVVNRSFGLGHGPRPAQTEVLGAPAEVMQQRGPPRS